MGVIPQKIIVGFNNRAETYTGKLGYVCYLSGKNLDTVKQAKSFYGWIDNKIPTETFDNEPTTGFVLNHSAGGSSWGWNGRVVKARVYDPRGFEFEIDMENLLYILEHTDSYKGKALEGEFVYAWMGSGSVSLIPVDSPAYKDHFKNIEKLAQLKQQTAINKKDLVVGNFYLNTKNQICRYHGAKGDGYFDQFEVYGRFGEYYLLNGCSVLAKTMVEELEYLPSLYVISYMGKEASERLFSMIDPSTQLSDKIDVTVNLLFRNWGFDSMISEIKINDNVVDIANETQVTINEKITKHPKVIEIFQRFKTICLEKGVDNPLEGYENIITSKANEVGIYEMDFLNVVYHKKYDLSIIHDYSCYKKNNGELVYEDISYNKYNQNRLYTRFYELESDYGYSRYSESTNKNPATLKGTYHNIYYCEI